MTIKDAVDMLSYGTPYEIKGAYSGKVYHKSYINSNKNFEKYVNKEVVDTPFYVDLRLRGADTNSWCIAVVVIWMCDYDDVSKHDG